jgi:N-acetylglucosaminyldiphosphoundecaprenol N-acetyl-beta-D-mannosaminyltransferase
MQPTNVDICGVRHSVVDYAGALSLFETWIRRRRQAHQVCVSNVHTTIACRRDAGLRRIAGKAALVTMDGQPLRWYANLIHRTGLEDRLCGPDLMLRTIEYGLERGWRHYFLGGRPEVLDALCDKLKRNYPELVIAGAYSPPFRELTETEDAELVERINAAGTDVLWVGLGAPKQEKWIASHLECVKAPVQVGVGAAFDFHAGSIKRAPLFMQRSGLEWFYRVSQDPRLFSRYLSTNPVFLGLFARDLCLSRFKSAWSRLVGCLPAMSPRLR